MHLAEISGPARTLHPRLEALASCGELVTLVPGEGLVERAYAEIGGTAVRDYRPLTLPRSPRAAAAFARAFARDLALFRKEIRSRRPHLVVVATSMLPAALLAARLENVPSIAYVCELVNGRSRGLAHRLAAGALLRFTRSYADWLVCASDAVARQFPGPHRLRVTTIHPGIPAGSQRRRDPARRALGVPKGAFCVAAVGSISEGRGQDLLLRALPRLLGSLPDTCCLLAGEPHPRPVDLAYHERLGELARELGVEQRVFFLGAVDPVDDVYAAADVVVNPARVEEGFGRVALEALAAGTPVVVTRVGAVPDILTHETEALFVEPDEPDAIANAVSRLHADEGLRERLVQAGRDLVRRKFGEKAGIEAFLRIASGLLEHRRARAEAA